MTALLIRLFVGKNADPRNQESRARYGVLAGLCGVLSNLLLFGGKMAVGVLSSSVSITADAFNNLSDCVSSLVTLVGFRMAGMPADDEHPWGHGRFEYISGLVVSLLILLIGAEFFKSSLEKILHPRPVLLTPLMLAVLAGSILVKLWQSLFYRRLAADIDSATLRASAADSRNDCITTGAVLLGAGVIYLTGWSLDGWLGLAVAVFILVSGVGLVRKILGPLLGAAPDPALVGALQELILAHDSVLGVHDLMVHSYGPGRSFASAHVEMPASQDILASHDILDHIEREIAQAMNISLVLHLDPVITDDAQLDALRRAVVEAVADIDPVLTVHDFRVAAFQSHSNLLFEITVPPRFPLGDEELRERTQKKIDRLGRPLRCIITLDRSYTSTTGEWRRDRSRGER